MRHLCTTEVTLYISPDVTSGFVDYCELFCRIKTECCGLNRVIWKLLHCVFIYRLMIDCTVDTVRF
jgi:hypothetical protein